MNGVAEETFRFHRGLDLCTVISAVFAAALAASVAWALGYLAYRTVRSLRRPPGPLSLPGPAVRELQPATQPLRKEKPLDPVSLAGYCLLLGAIALVVLATEGPSSMTVRQGGIDLRFTLPLRNETIPVAAIRQVQLEQRSKRRRGLGSAWPALIIAYGDNRVEVMGETTNQYGAVVDAYRAIMRLTTSHAATKQTIAPRPPATQATGAAAPATRLAR